MIIICVDTRNDIDIITRYKIIMIMSNVDTRHDKAGHLDSATSHQLS